MKTNKFPLAIIRILDKNNIKYDLVNNGAFVTMHDISKNLDISPGSIMKTLVLETPIGSICVALPGNRRLSFKKIADVLHLNIDSINLLPRKNFELIVGVPIGATPPIGLDFPLFVDTHLAEHDSIYCSCGTLVDIIGMKYADFIKVSDGRVVDITE